jgi:phospholipid-binding lipoprotein MlaA
VGWVSIRGAAGWVCGSLALALGGCGGLPQSDVLLLTQASSAQVEPEALDPISPIPVIAGRQAAPWSGSSHPATEIAAEGQREVATSPPETGTQGPALVAPVSEAKASSADSGSGMVVPVVSDEDPSSWPLEQIGFLDQALDLETPVVLAFEPIADETLVRIMPGLREWPTLMAQASAQADADEFVEHDPWEPFNETMFEFNLDLDRYVLKPVAKVWDAVVPNELKLMIARGFDNFRATARIVNSLLQAKWSRAGTETSRFLINSTLGFAGLWDIARQEFGIERPDAEDFGQTLGVWGVGPGPFLVLPVLAPTTVRDLIGRVVDGFLGPAWYFTPFVASVGLFIGDTINDRALNLDLFQGFEETTLDFYSAVRNAYLSRRARQIRD